MASRKVRFFVSYARANKELAAKFREKLDQQVGASRRYRYLFWSDADLRTGKDWDREIQKAIAACDLGLLLVSPAFLSSRYIKKRELPRFAGQRAKAVIPVMLQPVNFQRQDLKGLQKKQIFRLEGPRSLKAFGECAGPKRDAFAHELFLKIEERLDRLFKPRRR